MGRLYSLILAVLVASLVSVSAFAAAPKPSPAKKAAAPMRARAFTGPETIKGTLSLVELRKGLIVVTDPGGVPYDFEVGHASIEVNGSRTKMAELKVDIGKPASVHFLPFRFGDVARKVVIAG